MTAKKQSSPMKNVHSVYEYVKNSKAVSIAFIALLLVILMAVAVHVRTGAVNLEFADHYAESVISNNIRAQISQEVSSQNPLLSDIRRADIVNQRYVEFRRENAQEIALQKEQFANQIRSQFQTDDGQTYLIAIDTYFYFRFYRNIIETGMPGEFTRVVDGEERSFTNFQLAPTERDVTHFKQDFHVFFSVWIFKFVQFFNKDVTPLAVFFMIPAIFAALLVLPSFFLGREFGGTLGGFLLAFILVTHRQILARTPAGFSDTDIYAFLFPILVLLFVIYSLKSKKLHYSLIHASIAGFFLAVFALAWDGWWNIIYFIGALYAVYVFVKLFEMCHSVYKKQSSFKLLFAHVSKHLDYKKLGLYILIPVTFLVSLSLFATLFGKSVFAIIRGVLGFINFTRLRDATVNDLWPNVFTTVAELTPGNMTQIIDSLSLGYIPGGIVLLGLLGGLTLYVFKGKGELAFRLAVVAMIISWGIAMAYATTKGIRFLMFMAIPLSIASSIVIPSFLSSLAKFAQKELSIKRYITSLSLLVLLVVLVIYPMYADAASARVQQIPSMNDGWYDTLTNIRDNSDSDAIISSWWDFGHQFITIARRGATADGANQNTPQAHWLGKMLLADSFTETTGILRKLNCGGNTAFQKVFDIKNDTLESKLLVDQLVLLSKSEAQDLLSEKGFTQEQQDTILTYSHCEPPQSFLITSEDMGCIPSGQGCAGKTGVWAHFGGWDFTRSQIWNIVRSNTTPTAAANELLLRGLATEDEASSLVSQLRGFTQQQGQSWISPWPGYLTPMTPCEQSNQTIRCQNGGVIHLDTMTATIQVQQGLINVHSLVFVDAEEGYTVQEIDPNSPYSMVLRLHQGNIEMMIATPVIAKSSFTRLFYLNDGGDYFNIFSDVTDVTGQRIIVWETLWDTILE